MPKFIPNDKNKKCLRCKKPLVRKWFPKSNRWEDPIVYGKRIYCDQKCLKGIHRHLWKKKVQKWEGNYRARQLFKKIGVCEICKEKKRTEIHHKDENKLNNNLKNLQEICRGCHTKQHQTKARKTCWKKRKRNKLGHFV